MGNDLLRLTPSGLFCEAGGFFIDPTGPVDRAVITHAHADHARKGSRRYLTAERGRIILQTRMGPAAEIATLPYGTPLDLNGVQVSFHPAGHILGSAQVRVEYQGEVWVVTGDYKTTRDRIGEPFELVRCHTLITESTFGSPQFAWSPEEEIFSQIDAWWARNQMQGRASVLYAYALGKAQRVLSGLSPDRGPIVISPEVEQATEDYRASGVTVLPRTVPLASPPPRFDWSRALLIAPPSAMGSRLMRRCGAHATGFASGWMCLPDAAARRRVETGFVLSDHADWTELTATAIATGAERVLVMHGDGTELIAWLQLRGVQAERLDLKPRSEPLSESIGGGYRRPDRRESLIDH